MEGAEHNMNGVLRRRADTLGIAGGSRAPSGGPPDGVESRGFSRRSAFLFLAGRQKRQANLLRSPEQSRPHDLFQSLYEEHEEI